MARLVVGVKWAKHTYARLIGAVVVKQLDALLLLCFIPSIAAVLLFVPTLCCFCVTGIIGRCQIFSFFPGCWRKLNALKIAKILMEASGCAREG